MELEKLLTKSSENYRFHGVRGATLRRLIAQAEHGQIALWGTDHDDHIDEDEEWDEAEYVQGAGYLYTTDISGLGMSYNEFTDESGLVLVLEKQVESPFEFILPSDRRQHIIKVEDWKVIGGLRATDFDEDGDYTEDEAISLSDILSLNF